MIIIMVLGVVFSVSNFISIETKAGGMRGVVDQETGKCVDKGDECGIFNN